MCAASVVATFDPWGMLHGYMDMCHSYCGCSRHLAGAAADDKGTQRPSHMSHGGQQRQRRQQVNVAGVGVVLEPARETARLLAVGMCGTAASRGPVGRP